MNINLKGKTALIAGSTAGIGWAIAQELSNLGANCILLARNESKLKESILQLANNGNQSHKYIVADFSKPYEMIENVTEALKEDKVEILINNTGGPAGGAIFDADAQQFLDAYQQHLICNHLLAQAIVPKMKESNYGRIVNVISTSVKIPLKGLGVSNTTRGAVASWSKTLSNELAPFGITVNNILPGATMTGRLDSIIDNKANKLGQDKEIIQEEMISEIPMGRFGKPEEIANVAAFLCTPSASYLTGVSIQVDGGRTGTI